MQLKALKVYCDVITCRSFSRAATENGVSQSGVSQIVGQLEDHLGAKLIDRSKRPFVVTSEGEVFFQGCKKVLSRFESLEEEIRTMQQDVAGRVSVASIYSIGLHQLNLHVQRFMKANPKANVRLEYQHPSQVVEMVENDRADVGMVSYPKSTRSIKSTLLQNEPMVLVCSPEHPFARWNSLSVQELNGVDFVAFDEGLKIRRELDRALAAVNVEPKHTMEFDNIETMKRAVEIDSGVSLLPEPTVQRELRLKTMIAIRLSDIELTRPIGMLIRQGNPLGKTAELFVEFLKETWQEFADSNDTRSNNSESNGQSAYGQRRNDHSAIPTA